MATVDTTLNSKVRSLPKLEMEKGLRNILERTEKGINGFFAYPAHYGKEGSSETNWVLIDWLSAKVENHILRNRKERI